MLNKIKKWWLRFTGKDLENNIYIDSLKIGYDRGSEGLSLNELVKELDIDLSNNSFNVNFTTWFYTNFYNEYFEPIIARDYKQASIDEAITEYNIELHSKKHKVKSYIKGDAINKYIDFVELKRTRKSSRNASTFSVLALILAVMSIILPRINPQNTEPEYNINSTINRYECSECKSKDSTKSKPRAKNMQQSKTATRDTLNNPNQPEPTRTNPNQPEPTRTNCELIPPSSRCKQVYSYRN